MFIGCEDLKDLNAELMYHFLNIGITPCIRLHIINLSYHERSQTEDHPDDSKPYI